MARKHPVGQDGPAIHSLTIKITARQRERLEAYALAERRPLSSYVRNLLEDHLAVTPVPKPRRIAAFDLPEGVDADQFLERLRKKK